MAGSVEERDFRLGWSVWRRGRTRQLPPAAKRQAELRERPSGEKDRLRITPNRRSSRLPLTPEEARLTDAEWERVHPLLPPQRGRVGRPPNAIIARCSAASCGSSGPAARGERCLRSTET